MHLFQPAESDRQFLFRSRLIFLHEGVGYDDTASGNIAEERTSDALMGGPTSHHMCHMA